MKTPSLYDIIEAFPDEIIPQTTRHIARINRTLRPYRKYFEQLEKAGYDRFTKYFIREAVRILYMPKEVEHLDKLKKMQKIVKNKGKAGEVSRAEVDKAKSVSICSLIEHKRRGGKYWARCPFHADGNERTPSFVINKDNTGHCFSCGWHGDSIAFVSLLYGYTFRQAVRFLNGR